MPELPEVETLRIQLHKSLVGKKIKEVKIYTDKMAVFGHGKISNIKIGSKAGSANFVKSLVGEKIKAVGRRAKHLAIELGAGAGSAKYLIVHLRMTGQLIFLSKSELKNPIVLSLAKSAIAQLLPNKHTHVEFTFTDGSKLFYNDIRQFGYMRLVDQQGFEKVFAEVGLGPEPLQISAKQFAELLAHHPEKRAKDLLLNQQIIAGIGNIYADESLFAAKIHPARKIKTLSAAEIKNLHAAIQKILKHAIKLGGSSVQDFLMVNGQSGTYAQKHKVYAKAGRPCPVCGRPLKSAKIAGRTTVFCSHCQK